MTTISLPDDQRSRLAGLLRQARRREIGGILMGEQVALDAFKVVDFTVDGTTGTAAHFVRDPEHHLGALAAFFRKTGKDYRRFNYLGEWHSHPSFPTDPSAEDARSMTELVEGERGIDFAVLLIVRLRWPKGLEANCIAYAKDGVTVPCALTR